MAGAGYKLFNTGDVLTAAQVNTYLQEQAVMRFASATARTTALSGVLAEGMVSYLMDTNAVEVYDGSAWVGVATGDITAVTAGTGISGGGTSGAVTITNSMATEITAAGDIIVGTGSGTFDNLPIGTTGQVLTADTTVSPYKVKWATAAAGGATMTLVSTTTLSGTTTNITGISSSYNQLILLFANVTNSAGDTLAVRINSDTTNYTNSNYRLYSGTVTYSASSGVSRIALSYDANTSTSGFLQLSKYDSTKYVYSGRSYGSNKLDFVDGFYSGSAAATTVSITSASGSFAGTVYLYGA